MNLSNIIRENKYAKRKEKNEDNEKSISRMKKKSKIWIKIYVI